MTNPSEPAFPCPATEGYPAAHGITRREYFACAAMQAIVGSYTVGRHEFMDIAVECAVQYADALIEALGKEGV